MFYFSDNRLAANAEVSTKRFIVPISLGSSLTVSVLNWFSFLENSRKLSFHSTEKGREGE